MAKRPTTTNVSSGFNSQETINANFDAIVEHFDNFVSRDGSTPNHMNADLDMNSKDITNVNSINAAAVNVNGQSLFTPTLQSVMDGTYQASASDIQTAGRMEELTDTYSTVYLPTGTVETDQTMLWTIPRGDGNNNKEGLHKRIIGTGGLIKYTGTDWALKNTDLGLIYPRPAVEVKDVYIELTNASAKGGIRLYNVHHSRIWFNHVYGAADVIQGGIGIYMDAFGDRLGANSNGGCNQNLVAYNKIGRDLDPFDDDDTTSYVGSISTGILFAGSRATRATCGQNLTLGNKIFNFANAGIAFSGCEPDPAGVDAENVQRFTPTYDYRIAEGAVGNYCYADTMVCQRTVNACRLSDRETYLSTLNRPPVGYLYDARNGLTIRDCHLEKVGIPVLVTHGADRELSMVGGNQLTNSGFVQNDGSNSSDTDPSISNVNKPVLEKYPDSSFSGAGMPAGYTFTTFMDKTDKTHYLDGDEFLSAIPTQSTEWAALATSANEDKTTSSYTTISDFEDALVLRKRQRIFDQVDYQALTIGG